MKVIFLQDNGINESLSVTDAAGLLKANGHECDLFIEKNERSFEQRIKDASPGLIVVPMDIWGERKVLGIAERAKKTVDAPILFCGTYPLLFPEISDDDSVDIVCLGEAEYPILELANHLESHEDFSDIPNLVVKRNGETVVNEMRPLIQNLDSLPLPDRNIYFKYGFIKNFSVKRFTSGRGCPNACSFCYNAIFKEKYRGKGKFVRRKSVDRVIEEIESVKNAAPIGSIHFSDDLFTDDSAWVVDFCEKYSTKFKYPWTCNTAVHAVNDEMLAAMKKSRCHGIAMGVESGREHIRIKYLNKPYKDQEIIDVAKKIKSHGISLTSFNMMAVPYEKIDDVFATVSFNRLIKADNVRIFLLSPIPRTKLVNSAIKDGILCENYEENGAQLMSPHITSDDPEKFKSLFFLFDIALISSFFERLVRRLIRFKIPLPLGILLLLPRIWKEKKFFNIKLISGFAYFLNTNLPQNRTKNYNNYLP